MESDYLKLDDGFVIRRIRPHEKLRGETIFELQGQNYFLEFVSDLGLDEEIAEFPMPFEDQRLQFFLESSFYSKKVHFHIMEFTA